MNNRSNGIPVHKISSTYHIQWSKARSSAQINSERTRISLTVLEFLYLFGPQFTLLHNTLKKIFFRIIAVYHESHSEIIVLLSNHD